jgi:Mce-associated membrane protein
MNRVAVRKVLRRAAALPESTVKSARSTLLAAMEDPTEDASLSPAPAEPGGDGQAGQPPGDASCPDPDQGGAQGGDADAGDDALDWPDDPLDHATGEAENGAEAEDSAPTENPSKSSRASRWHRQIPMAVAISLLTMLVLGGLAGWNALRAGRSESLEHQRDVFLQAGRQAALDLTTISYTDVDAGVQRILESSTGAFHKDFQQRSKPLADLIRQTQSRTEGTIAAAGLESVTGDSAQVMVAVSVKNSDQSAAEEPPRTWRMRIDIQQIGGQAKVSNVAFVP